MPTPHSSLLTPYSLLITGGCGFIGTNFLDFMLKKGFTRFRILDNLSVGKVEDLESVLSEHGRFEKNEETNRITYSSLLTPHSSLTKDSSLALQIALIIGDIRNLDDCIRATRGMAAVLHLAAQSGVPTSVENPLYDCEMNVMGTVNVLEACRSNGVDKFVFASSGAPLGEVEPPIHEKKLPKPVSPYGASKLAGEAYCHAYYKTFGIKTVALRFGNVYGPRSGHKTSVAAKFFKRALEGQPLEIYGDGTQTRDFIYMQDLCNAIFLSLCSLGLSPQSSVLSPEVTPNSSLLTPYSENGSSLLTPNSKNNSSFNKVAGEVFQIATFKETTVGEIAEKIKALVENGTGEKVDIIHTEKRLGDVQRNFSDISKAMNMLGFKPEYNLDKGLTETWDFFCAKQEVISEK